MMSQFQLCFLAIIFLVYWSYRIKVVGKVVDEDIAKHAKPITIAVGVILQIINAAMLFLFLWISHSLFFRACWE